VTKLEPPNTHFLSAAEGWLELGNPEEAEAELRQLPAALRAHPEVLEMRWRIHAKTENWAGCVEVADELVTTAPKRPIGWIHRSYALHELNRTREALEALLPAQAKFPRNWLIHYNLACYCCRLKDIDRARYFFDRACRLGEAKEVKAMAEKDEDLQGLWKKT
jgi:predicted Zn-dependent protease